ncbi:phosphomannomutase/phosphoglucomutase [Clostridium uliginosum]|uniref:Phosphomannomutase n=1 Tax=Clostridium uliginosum TaxID=119641 RepID=A0A1I1J979_9CLOT|nr:phosphomannomutase/phosphoglucomutase [Clostridium uliginosum]SFC41990.1 Phosphomannomutase [Clostridium uliginosum]
MSNKHLYNLQNETDIRGIALKNNEKEVTLTNEEVKAITIGFYKWMLNRSKTKNLKISVGMDSRLTGNEFKHTIIRTLVSFGATVYDCNVSTTPAMFMTTVISEYKCDGAIMITASHLPYYYNGIKFFTEKGGLEKEDIKEILDLACNEKDNKLFIGEIETRRLTRSKPLIDDYSKILVEKIRKEVDSKEDYNKPLKGLNIIVDAGNGAGGFFKEKVLEEVGANTKGSQFIEPDGTFPNHIPNPENKEAMESISKAVLENNCDLGIIFDTDVDRAALVGRDGKFINKNALIAVISAIVLEEHKGTTIVTDSVTSDGLGEFIENLGGKHHRFKRGYKNVINEAIRLNKEGEECHIAIETSGHAAIKENYFLDDGAYLISKILVKVAKLNSQGKTIEDLILELKVPEEENEIRIKINGENYKECANKILKELENLVNNSDNMKFASNNYDGLRVICNSSLGDGWFLLRLSLHEPLIVINIESNKKGGVQEIISFLREFLKGYDLSEF